MQVAGLQERVCLLMEEEKVRLRFSILFGMTIPLQRCGKIENIAYLQTVGLMCRCL